MHTILITPCD